MATTISTVQDLVNQYLHGDTSTNSVSANDRLRAISEATKVLHTEVSFDLFTRTFDVDYFDTINYYNILTDIPDFLEPVDIRKVQGDHDLYFARKNPREFAVDLDNGTTESAITIERKNRKNYLGITQENPKYRASIIHNCDSLTNNGTWTLSATAGDGVNLTLDDNEFKDGSASLNFDADVSQTANNKVVIYNPDIDELDLSDHEDLSSFVFWAYLPSLTSNTFTVKISSDTASTPAAITNYWSGTATTDMFGAAFVVGWNRIKLDWADMTATGSPDASAIVYVEVDYNYGAGQGDDTDYRLDDIIVVRPEKLTFFYETWALGETSTSDSTLVYEFAATTNVPFYSGIYDHANTYVAHAAAAILFRQIGLTEDANNEEGLASRELKRLKMTIPSAKLEPTKNFKVQGMNWNRSTASRIRRRI